MTEYSRCFQPAIDKIRELLLSDEEILMVAIDGHSGAGKTTLADCLSLQFDANIFHLDDFYLRKEMRTPERLQEAGGNVDYERFREEVLIPVWYGDPVQYRPYDCRTLSFLKEAEKVLPPKRLNIMEGSYSSHPYFGNPYQLRIFMDIDPAAQLENLKKRVPPEKLPDFTEKWIPMENAYFEKFDIKKDCLVIKQST